MTMPSDGPPDISFTEAVVLIVVIGLWLSLNGVFSS